MQCYLIRAYIWHINFLLYEYVDIILMTVTHVEMKVDEYLLMMLSGKPCILKDVSTHYSSWKFVAFINTLSPGHFIYKVP
jgi:hypothetical protein